jgi:hypothetical protein
VILPDSIRDRSRQTFYSWRTTEYEVFRDAVEFTDDLGHVKSCSFGALSYVDKTR